MTDPITHALVRIVEQSTDPDDLSQRVTRSYGKGAIERARHIAYEIKGEEWLFKGKNVQEDKVPDSTSEQVPALRRAELLVLASGVTLLLVALLFPPFIVPLSDGFITNAGFAFIFSPPTRGIIVAIVNVQLLAVLILGIFSATCIAYFLCKKLNKNEQPPS